MPTNATGAINPDVRDAAISVVQNQFGVSSITQLGDHVMLSIPPETGNWASSATVGGCGLCTMMCGAALSVHKCMN